MSRDTKPNPKRAKKDFDSDNFSIAKIALANPEKYPHLAAWAPIVMARLGSKQRTLPLKESSN